MFDSVFGGAEETVRQNGTHLPGPVQGRIQSAARVCHPGDAGLHQAGTRPGGGQAVSEPRVQASVQREPPGSAPPTRLRTQASPVRRGPVYGQTERGYSTRTTAGSVNLWLYCRF